MVQLGEATMRQVLVLVAVAASALSQSVPIHACGDKLMMLGRGIRFQSKHTPRAAAVLLYLPESAAGQALTDPKLESALREAGHAVRAVTSQSDLESSLQGGTFDVVLANGPTPGSSRGPRRLRNATPCFFPRFIWSRREPSQSRSNNPKPSATERQRTSPS